MNLCFLNNISKTDKGKIKIYIEINDNLGTCKNYYMFMPKLWITEFSNHSKKIYSNAFYNKIIKQTNLYKYNP